MGVGGLVDAPEAVDAAVSAGERTRRQVPRVPVFRLVVPRDDGGGVALGDRVALGVRLDVLADVFDDPGELVARHHREIEVHPTGVHVDVGATDAVSLHSEQHLVRPRLGDFDLAYLDRPRFNHDDRSRLHVRVQAARHKYPVGRRAKEWHATSRTK